MSRLGFWLSLFRKSANNGPLTETVLELAMQDAVEKVPFQLALEPNYTLTAYLSKIDHPRRTAGRTALAKRNVEDASLAVRRDGGPADGHSR